MPNSPNSNSRQSTNHLPSRAVTVGAVGGGGAGTLAVWVFSLFGIDVPAEVAPALAAVLGGVLAYFVRGGRKQ